MQIAGNRGVRLGFGHGSAGPRGSDFGLIRTGWRASRIRFSGPRLRHQRLLAAIAAGGLDRLNRHVQAVERDLLYPQRVEELPPVVAEGGQQHVDGAHAAQRRPGLGVQVGHQHGAVAGRQPVEADAAPLGQYLSDLDVVALAAALLLRLADVAVVHRAAAGRRVERRALDAVAVGELGAVVGQEQAERPGVRRGRGLLQRVEPLADGLRGLLGHQQRQLELERPGVQCQQALPVGPEPHDGVHLAGGGALLVGQSHERGVGARLAVGRRLARLGVRPGLVAALPSQVEVAHPRVSALYPPVYGGRRGLDLVRPGQRDLLGRQPARYVRPYQAHYVFELGLVPVHAHPRLAQLGVGERLRPGRRVLAAPRPAAVVPAESAPVAAARPLQEPGACRVGRPGGPAALARPSRHGAVARHLVGDRRRRSSQLSCHLPAGLALVEAPLDRGALGPVQPAVRLGCLLPHVFPFSREGLRPPPQERILELSRTCSAEFENETKVFG